MNVCICVYPQTCSVYTSRGSVAVCVCVYVPGGVRGGGTPSEGGSLQGAGGQGSRFSQQGRGVTHDHCHTHY